MRTIRGMWACSDPRCSGVPKDLERSANIGRLYATPRDSCDACGARVLELMYCFECGEPSLGGFVGMRPGEDGGAPVLLLSSTPTDPNTRIEFVSRRSRDEYAWYWPGSTSTDVAEWKHGLPQRDETDSPGTGRFRFSPAVYHPHIGALEASGDGATGMMLSVSAPEETLEARGLRVPALPERCPRCGLTSGNNNDREQFYGGTVRSAIRAHTTGVAVSAQVLLGRLFRNVAERPQDARTIVFTDSRDDAARTAAGVSLNHFRDLIRQLLRLELQESASPAELLARAAGGAALSDEETQRVELLKAQEPDTWTSYRMAARGVAEPDDQERIRRYEARHGQAGQRLEWSELLAGIEQRLVALGVNPAGPDPDLALFPPETGQPWWTLYRPPQSELWQQTTSQSAQREVARRRREHLAPHVAEAIFDRAGRDFESIALGWIEPSNLNQAASRLPLPEPLASQAVRSAIRILGQNRRYEGAPFFSSGVPLKLKQWAKQAEEAHGVENGVL